VFNNNALSATSDDASPDEARETLDTPETL
jgi:hypothetical protein